MHILIIEDNDLVRTMFVHMVESFGHTAETASSFSEAAAKIKTTFYPLVITDFDFPGGNGHEAAALAKAMNPKTYVALSSGTEQKNAGQADELMPKPAHIADLERVIENAENHQKEFATGPA